MEAKSEFTRSGPRRLGDRYQDLIAMEALVEWLENPGAIDAICIEDDEMGFLDDVVTYLSDGTVKLIQVKYSVEPGLTEFSWEYLLNQEAGARGPKTSLLQKWSKSFFEIIYTKTVKEARVLTNRKPSKEMESVLFGLKVNIVTLREKPFYHQIIDQIGGDEQAVTFFDNFEFALSQPSLDGLDMGLRNRFFRLGGSELGWFNLLNQIPFWASKKGKITLDAIKNVAFWGRLEGISQEYEIPEDFVSPPDQFTDGIKERINQKGGGCIVLTGGPGMGKSTYISYLYQYLYNNDIPVVRHHYFLSVHDRDYLHRIEYQAAAESIMYDIGRDYPDSVSRTSKRNPSPNDLRDWLEESGEYYSQQGKSLVVIIDGLDHVWREQRSIEELNLLFKHFWPIPKGIFLLLATQPVDDSKLPQVLLRSAPREQWIVLQPLNEVLISKWVKFQIKFWPKQDYSNEQYLDSIAQTLFKKSGGHPLYLRYAINYLVEQGKSFDTISIGLLPACPSQGITGYYENLWASLSTEGRVLLNLIVSSSFSWPKQELINCLNLRPSELAQYQQSLSEITHLLSLGDLGVRPFHNSLAVFVSSLPENEETAATLKRTILHWLNNKAPEYWKWGYLWLLDAELGNDDQLCAGITRTWLVQALAKRRLRVDVQNILSGSFKSLLGRMALPEAIKIGIYNEYAYTAYQFLEEVNSLLLMPQIIIESKEDQYFRARLFSALRSLHDSEIATLAEDAFYSENQRAIQRCLRELEERSDRNAKRIDYGDHGDELLISLLKVSALADNTQTIQIINWAIKNRKNKYCNVILYNYSRFLRKYKRISQMRNLVGEGVTKLRKKELDIVLKQAILLALEENIDFDQILGSVESTNSTFMQLYELFRNHPVEDLGKVELPGAALFSLSWSGQYDKKDEIIESLGNLLFDLLCNCLTGNDQANLEWLKLIKDSSWLGKLVYVFHGIAKSIAMAKSSWSISLLYQNLSGLPKPKWNESRDETGYLEVVMNILPTICFDLLALYSRDRTTITDQDIQVIFSSEYTVIDSWLMEYLHNHRFALTDQAVKWLIKSQSDHLVQIISPMADRAKSYALLASLSIYHNLYNDASLFITCAAENMIGHYYHKDLLLDSILNVIKSCHMECTNVSRDPAEIECFDLLMNLAPAISKIFEFTDGDETSHLPVEFGKVLYHVDAGHFMKYLHWLRYRGDYDDELDLLHYYLSYSNLNDPLDQAIAGTGIDDASISIVMERANVETPLKDKFNQKFLYLGEGSLLQARLKPKDSSNAARDEKEMPIVEQYPPDSLESFMDELNTRHIIYKEQDCISRWVSHWKAIDGERTYLALVNLSERTRRYHLADLIYELSVDLYGNDKSFPWLVSAQKEELGWSRFYSAKDKAVRRWKYIKDRSPDKWYEFIRDSFGGGTDDILRLVEYCFYFEQFDLAVSIMYKFVEGAQELLSPLRFPLPQWIEK